ncbi:unnamed protein product [Prorocentrum cordatum]|uniref:Secreted protein n=1 Tax=Prorocentrum cordatum TaxID=2364126 RepID=A0ABN9QJP0_9DINO|nr:unnamed protein product [Polarella glacialis]
MLVASPCRTECVLCVASMLSGLAALQFFSPLKALLSSSLHAPWAMRRGGPMGRPRGALGRQEAPPAHPAFFFVGRSSEGVSPPRDRGADVSSSAEATRRVAHAR